MLKDFFKVDVDDLDNLATPEMIMLSAVSGEGAQDRWVTRLFREFHIRGAACLLCD